MFQQAVLDLPRTSSWTRTLFLVIGGSLLIALFARISVPLPFSPVPMALQGHICLLLGALLGSRIGSLAVLTYLIQGALGLPVFALGKAGFPVLLGPTGGYLMGYLAATWITGYLIERSGSKSLRQAMLAMTLGNLVIYLCGLPQLALYVGVQRVFFLGMLPFLIGDGLKLILAYKALKSFRQKFGWNSGEFFPS
jgi:biotin transport system substrate-specific component